MSRKSIVHRSIRVVDGSIARTVDGKDDNSVSVPVSTEDAGTQYMIPKHIVDGFNHHEFLFQSREAGTREVQKAWSRL